MIMEKISIPYKLGTKLSRTVKLTTEEFSYTGQVWSIDEGQEHKARVLLLHNPGEDVSLYYRLITLLSKNGYETFFCQMSNIYTKNVDIYREINRILEMCIIDLDEQKYTKCHKLHIMGHFIGGSRILNYCVKGRFKHRLKSAIVINPFITPNAEFRNSLNDAATSFLAMVLPKAQRTAFPIEYEHLTSNTKWINYMKSNNYDFTSIKANYLREIQHISHVLQNRKKFEEFMVRNVLIIHSKNDPICSTKGSKYFIDHCPADNAQYMKYEEGRNNLFIENDLVFKKLSYDLLNWLQNN